MAIVMKLVNIVPWETAPSELFFVGRLYTKIDDGHVGSSPTNRHQVLPFPDSSVGRSNGLLIRRSLDRAQLGEPNII